MRNKRFRLICLTCQTDLEDNESYDFRINMYKTEGQHIWVFVDDHIDLSGMVCRCSNPESIDWDAIEISEDKEVPNGTHD